MHLRFSFDFISPYAWFAWTEIRDLARRNNATISFHPVLFAGLLNHWEHKGPAEIPAKRIFTVKQTARRAARIDLPFRWPQKHPFNPLTALRMALPEVSGDDDQERVIDLLFRAIWTEGIDGQNPEHLVNSLTEAGLDGAALYARTREPAVKRALLANTTEAVRRGLWGVPTIEADTEVFWGHDSLSDLEAFVRGEDPIDAAAIEDRANAMPVGSSR